MKAILLYIIFAVALGLFISSCNKEIEEVQPKSATNKFFPLKVGDSITYQIKEIIIDKESAVNDTLNYKIKEILESQIENTEILKSYRLERYYQDRIGNDWVLLNVWQIRQYQRRIHKVEDNIEYIRLLTPTIESDAWDVNVYNAEENLHCEISKIENNMAGNMTAYVVYQDKSSLIDKKFSEEQYSEKIGLVSKTKIDVELNIDPSLPWEKKIIKGTIYYQNIIFQDE